MFNVIIIGGENTENFSFFTKKCIFYLGRKAKSNDGITIFSTGDKYTTKFASNYGIAIQYFIPEWKKYGKMALKERNVKMLEQANGLILFDNEDNSFDYLISEANKKHIPIRIVKKESF